MKNSEIKEKFIYNVRDLQAKIVQKMKDLDSRLIVIEDQWKRQDFNDQDGGGGLTICLREGEVFESAGVNTSVIHGAIDPQFADKLKGEGHDLFAAGISLILHPRNPKVPTVHANFRMIEHGSQTWFGGGADLTPFYPFEEDFQYFHETWHKSLQSHYGPMKKNCDEYFVNHHREGEMRGVGGFFFDHFQENGLEGDYEFVSEQMQQFIASYFPIVEKRKDEPFTKEDEDFMLHRRGRYIEFNLLHDRGTLFGLKTKGRIDSILISLPARAKYTYAYHPGESTHQKMMEYYYPREWSSLKI